MDTLAKRIVGRRQELGLTSTDLADLCGISLTAVLKWENGRTENLKHEHLFVLCDALNVNPRWLALGDGPKIASPTRKAQRKAMLQRERVKDDRARGVWDRLVSALGKAAMVLALALPPFMVPRAEARVDHNLFVSAFARQVFALNTHCLAWLRRLLRFLTTRWTTGQTA